MLHRWSHVRGWWLLGLGLLAACAHSTGQSPAGASSSQAVPPPDASPHDLAQDDWLVVHSTKEGPRQVITRQEFAARKARGEHVRAGASLEHKPPVLLTVAPPVHVGVGQVRTFMFEDTAIKRLVISGGTAEAYWSKPYTIHRMEPSGSVSEHEGSDLYIRGAVPGHSELEIEFADGRPPKTIPIEVGGAGHKPVG